MTIEKDGSLTIADFPEGIGQSILSPYADMLGVNIIDNPGVASVNFKFNKVTGEIPAQTFTVTTDRVVTSSPLIWRSDEEFIPVTVSTTGTLPTGLTAGTIYYTEKTATNTYKLKTAIKGTGYASITAATGSGTHTITPVTPKAITSWTQNSQGRIFALDSNQKVWFCGTDAVSTRWYLISGNTTSGDGAGIIYYKGYILVFGNAGVDALTDIQNPESDTIVWKNNFDTITISNGGKALPFLSVNDNYVYFYSGVETGRYYKIGLLEETAGQTFDPSNSATFSFAEDATKIPFENNGVPSAINEINQYLVIGTGSDKIYFWDKKSPAFTSFIKLQESGVSSIQSIDNTLYIFAGGNGNIYQANTVSSSLINKVPQQITGELYGVYNVEVNYSAVYRNEIIFSVTIPNATTTVKNYLMSYNIDTKKIVKRNISAFGETSERNGTAYGKINSIFVVGENILLGSSYYDTDTSTYSYSVESLLYKSSLLTGTATYYVYDNYEPYILTGLMTVGQEFDKATFRVLHLSLLRALTAGQGVRVSYRLDDSSSFTVIKTIDYATDGAIKDIKIPSPITNAIDLQLKIELKGLNLTSPMLKLVRFIK